MNPLGFVVAGAGVFAMCGAGFDWDWFMTHRRARVFVRLLGRTGARIVYAAPGAALLVLGLLLGFGVVSG